jgi:hypothetical protein
LRILSRFYHVQLISEWTRVEGGHEHEVGRERQSHVIASQRDHPLFERLPQQLEQFAWEFRQFIEKEQSVVR